MAFVFIFRTGLNHFKIGRTRNIIEKRRQELPPGTPLDISIFDHIETDHDGKIEEFLKKKLHNFISNIDDYETSPEVIETVINEARNYLDLYKRNFKEAKKYSACDHNESFKEANDDVKKIYKQLLNIREKLELLEFEKELLENLIKTNIADNQGIAGIASWKAQNTSRVDMTKFKSKYPEVYKDVTAEKKIRYFRLIKEPSLD